jgi:hypothetical protein
MSNEAGLAGTVAGPVDRQSRLGPGLGDPASRDHLAGNPHLEVVVIAGETDIDACVASMLAAAALATCSASTAAVGSASCAYFAACTARSRTAPTRRASAGMVMVNSNEVAFIDIRYALHR